MWHFSTHLKIQWTTLKDEDPVLFLLSRFSIDDNLQVCCRRTCNMVSNIIFFFFLRKEHEILCSYHSDFFPKEWSWTPCMTYWICLEGKKNKRFLKFSLFVLQASFGLIHLTLPLLVQQTSLFLLNTKYFSIKKWKVLISLKTVFRGKALFLLYKEPSFRTKKAK